MSFSLAPDGSIMQSMAGPHSMGGVLDASTTANMLCGLDDLLPMDLDQYDASLADAAAVAAASSTTFDPMSLGQENRADSSYDNLTGSLTPTNASNTMSAVGAGPLPTGFGIAPQNGNSALTEFTKRRNWSQRIIEELKDFLHILTPDGRIVYVSPSARTLTGYAQQQLVGRFIGEFVHPDDSGIFMREFNESIASGNALRFFYRFKKEDGTYVIFECDGHPHISTDIHAAYNTSAVAPISTLCKGFFMMARPYPTKNAALLDSFLEHKMENERLMKRIADLKREEVEENAQQERQWQEHSSNTPLQQAREGDMSESASRVPDSLIDAPSQTDYQDSVLSAQQPDSIADKMSRYEGSNHLETIEMLTGLRYRDGERSHGISTGDTSPALIRGDAGIAILLDRDRDGHQKEKKKKLKLADEYVCADCGTLDSPEWRKGPKGPKTLCNACGLRWAKKEKKKHGSDSINGGNSLPGGMSKPSLPQQSSGDSL
ncbi:hypothetical protein AAFC00_002696 [Neodothiora populina]|uniref:White collar-2 n=1 Tax=Neodothiora populina TaxID=2781224 RepID=A0ABR3P7Y9_9PEZI